MMWGLETIRRSDLKLEISISEIKDVINMFEATSKRNKYKDYPKYILGEVLAQDTNNDTKIELIRIFNENSSKYRIFLGKFFIAKM